MKTGAQHIQSLRDGRDVYIRGQRVDDVTTHPAFRNSIKSAAYLYDFLGEHVEQMTFVSPDSGGRVSRCWQLPGNYQELVERREALTAWAETHFGFMRRHRARRPPAVRLQFEQRDQGHENPKGT